MSFRNDADSDEEKMSGSNEDTSSSSASSSSISSDYNISDVRASLRLIRDEMVVYHIAHANDTSIQPPLPQVSSPQFDEVYCSILTLLHKITSNVLKQPVNPQHLSINLKNATLQKRFASGALKGVVKLLGFCGFTGQDTMQLAADRLPAYRTRIERACVIINKVKEEHTPESDEQESNMETDESNALVSSTSASAPASVFLANNDDDPNGTSSSSPQPVSDENMKPDLAPTYNIADVRVALKNLYSEIEASMPIHVAASSSFSSAAPVITPFARSLHALSVREAYVSLLDTLSKITSNLLKTPVNPAHCRINIASENVQKKFGRFDGAVEYLKFIGFTNATAVATEENNMTDATSPAATTSPSSSSSGHLMISEATIAESQVKLTRALSILAAQRAAIQPSTEEVDRRALGPISRDLRIFDLNRAVVPLNTALPAPNESPVEEGRGDLGLILSANLAERKRVHEMSRTDVIVTKTKQAEIRESLKRKYSRTLIKLTFSDKFMSSQGSQQQQGRGGRIGGGSIQLGFKSSGYMLGSATPKPTEAATPKADDVIPMELDEEKSDVSSNPETVNALSPAVLDTPAAALTPTTSAPISPAAPPPAEFLVCAYFRPWETLEDLFLWIRTELLMPSLLEQSFYLHLPPNQRFSWNGTATDEKTKNANAELLKKTLQALGLVPAASMIFHFVMPASSSSSSAASSQPPTPSSAASSSSSSTSSTATPPSILVSLSSSLIASAQSYDASLLASLIPIAENKTELEQAKLRAQEEVKQRERAAAAAAQAAESGGAGGGSSMADNMDDGDIEAYMRSKKKKTSAAASSSSSVATGRSGNSLGGSSGSTSSSSNNSAGGAASKRAYPAGLFKKK